MKVILFVFCATIACLSNTRPFAMALPSSGSNDMPAGQTSSSSMDSTMAAAAANSKGEIIVKYFDETIPPDRFPYKTCISLRNTNCMIKSFQVTTLAACYLYLDKDCKMPAEPLVLPVTPLLKTLNVADLGGAVAYTFLCMDFSESTTGEHLADPSMFGRLEHVGMGLTPPNTDDKTHHQMKN